MSCSGLLPRRDAGAEAYELLFGVVRHGERVALPSLNGVPKGRSALNFEECWIKTLDGDFVVRKGFGPAAPQVLPQLRSDHLSALVSQASAEQLQASPRLARSHAALARLKAGAEPPPSSWWPRLPFFGQPAAVRNHLQAAGVVLPLDITTEHLRELPRRRASRSTARATSPWWRGRGVRPARPVWRR